MVKAKWWIILKRLDVFLDVQVPFLVLMLLTVITRLPSLFEPYWYGDEGIYLVVGNALRQGLTLYSQIFDYKTPLIYYFAQWSGGSIVVWKIFGLVMALVSLFMFDQISKLLIGRRTMMAKVLGWIGDFVFVLLFNLPLLEGNVVNAEIFYVTFGLAGAFFWLRGGVLDELKLKRNQELQVIGNIKHDKKAAAAKITKVSGKKSSGLVRGKRTQNVTGVGLIISQIKVFWSSLIQNREAKRQLWLSLAAGFFFSLSFLTKFHGLFDLYAWVVPVAFFPLAKLREKRPALLGLLFGFTIPILFFIILFLIQGNLGEMWRAAFQYSFNYSNYAQTDQSALIQAIFSTKGRFIVLLGLTGAIWWQYRRLDLSTIVMSLWLLAATTGASLSNRSYAHYFLQIVPALVLCGLVLVRQSWRLMPLLKERKWLSLVINVTVVLGVGIWTLLNLNVLQIKTVLEWPVATQTTMGYYHNFYKYLIDKQNKYGMYGYFHGLMRDNYAVASLIQNDDNPYLFVWGNNPCLYAQTKQLPVTPYIVNYHLYDYAVNVKHETPLGLELKGLMQHRPTYAVVMNEIDGFEQEKADQREILQYLTDNYRQIYTNNSFELWEIDAN